MSAWSRVEQCYAELSDDGPQFPEVALRLVGKRNRGVTDPADLDAFVNVEWDGDDLRVELPADDARRDCVAVEPDHEVEDRRTVRDPDLLLTGQGGKNLLGEVEGVVRALIEG